MKPTQDLVSHLLVDVGPHLLDPRARAIMRASGAVRVPNLAGPHRRRLMDVERERTRLTRDASAIGVRGDREVTVSRAARVSSQPAQWCRFLHTLAYSLAPRTIVEMGTAAGISAASIATAVPRRTRMWTVDLRPRCAEIASDVFERVGVDVTPVTGRFADVLTDTLAEAAPVDFLYVDGHHDGPATLEYTEWAAPYLSKRAIVVYDDIRWSDGMTTAWKAIRQQSRWSFTADIHTVGVCALKGSGQ